MIDLRIISVLAMACLLTAAVGCGPREPRPDEQPAVGLEPRPDPADAPDPLRELNARVNQYIEHIGALPGRTDAEHRQLMQQIFLDLETILPMLGGRRPGGAFEQQLQIIESARHRVARAPPQENVEPAIESGLRAASGALELVKTRIFPGDTRIRTSLTSLRTQLRDLDAVRGPMHRLVTTEAVVLTGRVLQDMTAVLVQLDEERREMEEEAEEAVEPEEDEGS